MVSIVLVMLALWSQRSKTTLEDQFAAKLDSRFVEFSELEPRMGDFTWMLYLTCFSASAHVSL